MPYLVSDWNLSFLSVYDGGTRITGTLNHFSIETYDDYVSGIPIGVFESYDTPLDTLKRKTVYAETDVLVE